MNLLGALPASFWQLLTVCGVGFACLWWFVLGAPRFGRRRALRARIAALGPAESASELAELRRMRETIADARRARGGIRRHRHWRGCGGACRRP